MPTFSRRSPGWIALLLLWSAVPAAGAPASGGPTVLGTVLGPTGQPSAGARVELRPVLPAYEQARRTLAGSADPAPVATATTDAAGRFALPSPAPGLWRVTVQGTGSAPVQSPPVPLADSTELAPIALTAEAGASPPGGLGPDGRAAAPAHRTTIRTLIRVVARSGEAAPGALVLAGTPVRPLGETDAQGRCPLPLSGPAPLLLLAPDGRQVAVQAAPAAAEAERVLTLPEPLTLAGRVLDGTGRKPLAGALVWASADPGSFVRTDAAGRFRLPVPVRRRFEIEAVAPGFLPRKVAIPAPQLASGRAATLALERAGALRGQVVDPQGRPVAGAAITAVAEGSRGERALDPADPAADRAFSDAQGRFDLRRLRPEQTYEVRAFRTGSYPAGQLIAVGDPAAAPRSVTLVLAPARAARGRVQDPEGRPVAGARVSVRAALRPGSPLPLPFAGETPDERGAVVVESDSRGVFQLPACPAAEVELAVRRTGFAPAFLPALRIPPGPGSADLGVVVLRPGAPIAGQVVDAKSRAVAGAEVFVLRDPVDVNAIERTLQGRKPAATSAADGRFSIQDLLAGTPVHLVVRASGFLAAQVRAVRPPTARPVVVRLETETLLRGRVVDEGGDPVPGARIELRWQKMMEEDAEIPVGEPLVRATRSGADGRFAIGGLLPGGVTFNVAAQGFVGRQRIAAELPRPAEAGELRIVLSRGAVVQGRVTAAAGQPVPAVHVAAGDAFAATDDDGLYFLEGTAPGPREIIFVHPSYGRLNKSFDVQPGVNVLDVTFDAGVEVTGRVADDAGRPVPGARVELSSWDRFEMRQLQDVTGEDGRFRLAPVTPGAYRLAATAEGYADAELLRPVAVAADPVANLEIALSRGARVSGQILGLSPDDLAQVTVTAYDDDRGAEVPAWTDGRGRYEAGPLTPGDWTLRAALWNGQRRAQVRLAISRSDREVTRDLEFEPRLTLTALVLADDEPLADARVSVRGQHVMAERSGLTDYEGRVRFDDLEPDSYRLGVTEAKKFLVYNDQIELQQDREVVIRFETATLAGVVESAKDGAPVANALVSLRPLEGPDFMVAAGTKADGRFSLYHLQPGRYRLETQAAGYAAAAQEVQLAGGQSVESLEVRLDPAAGAKLRLRLASGQLPGLVHVLVRDPSGNPVLTATRAADAEGSVDLSSLPAGAWTLWVRADGSGLASAPLLVPTAEPLSLTLPVAGALRVRVPALISSSLLGTVRLLGANQQPFWTLGPGGAVETQWPLAGGKAVIDGVPAGTWIVQIETPDGQRWKGTALTSGTAEAAVTIE